MMSRIDVYQCWAAGRPIPDTYVVAGAADLEQVHDALSRYGIGAAFCATLESHDVWRVNILADEQASPSEHS